MITVIGLGLGTEDTLTLGALKALREAKEIVLQTGNVPVADYLAKEGFEFETLDKLYDDAADFEELLEDAADFFADRDDAVFGIIGNARSNAFAAELKKDHEVRVIPGPAQGEYALDLCGIDAAYARCIAADDIGGALIDARMATAVTEIDSPYRAADIALAFSRYYPHDYPIYFVKGSEVKTIPLCELDRQELAYNCAAVFPALRLEDRQAYTFEDLVDVMAILRSENGCPWDKQQTHVSLRQDLLEESYEVMDAIDKEDVDMLYDELGDVLFQTVFHAQIGKEQGEFDERDMTTNICHKMISRHTHVFGEVTVANTTELMKNWEEIKRGEKGEQTVAESMRNITLDSPLLRASKILKKAELAGMEEKSDSIDALKQLAEEWVSAENREAVAGDMLLALVKAMRGCGISGDVALNGACVRYIERAEAREQKSTVSAEIGIQK